MTTAHRPTWHNALGGENQGGNRLAHATSKKCARDQPGELSLKQRHKEQTLQVTNKLSLKKSLDARERQFQVHQNKAQSTLAALPEIAENPYPEDADDVLESDSSKEDDKDESEDESDEEELELMRELEKIKRERSEKEAAVEKERQEKQQKEQQERMLRANPLLMASGDLKRRWDDDVVFKNQAKNLPKPKRQFINDPVRSDFHKKFLYKYID